MKKRLNKKSQFKVSFSKGDYDLISGTVVAVHLVHGYQYLEVVQDVEKLTYLGDEIITYLENVHHIGATYLVDATKVRVA